MIPHNSGRRILRRSAADIVQLKVPYERVVKFCKKQGYGNLVSGETIHRNLLLHASDVEIVTAYNAELRGFATYYALAKDVKQKLNKLEYIQRGSLLKTLAAKHGTTSAKTLKALRDGTSLSVSYQHNGKSRKVAIWKLKDLQARPYNRETVDLPPFSNYGIARTELIERLNARQCEYCGQPDTPCEIHHVRKMADLKGTTAFRYLRATRLRKRIVLCRPCHIDLHAGRLPDYRYQQQVGVESRVQ
jgi:Type II intron maturase